MYKSNYYFPIRINNSFSINNNFSFFNNFDLDKFYFSFFRDFDILNFLFLKEFCNVSASRTFFINYSFFFINFITFYKFCNEDFFDMQVSENISFVFGSFFVFNGIKTSCKYYYVFSLVDFSMSLYFKSSTSILPIAFFKYSFYDYERLVATFNNIIKSSNKSFIFVDEKILKKVFSEFFAYLISTTPLPSPTHFKSYNLFQFFFIKDIIYSNIIKNFSFEQPIEYFTFSFIFKNFLNKEFCDFVRIKVFTFYKHL